ncbi:prolyl oligopeptidase family serine peptidase [Paenibacillus abyssi]|uniref:Phospholipase/carboxylesterase/thioesterase domain-containing protein n=1 Tax=Paenibacillus abyssi TaxID=1340531 RepID=A0A917D8W7_9BACL|nr:prolyl oligopeptidase family serine peptidase [Paenibacillus abyssi]GGG13358.1 hypothetical protein GCM10010916_32880 [Paenibacillus abyssi]
MPVEHHKLETVVMKKVSIHYQLFKPSAYEARTDKKWPVILFLHGMNKRGDDIHSLDVYGLNEFVKSKKDFEFLVITPQCPFFSTWPMERDAVIALVNEIVTNERVDTERIYLTGFSMGGNGVLDLAVNAPQLFAAVVPIAGWLVAEKTELLKHIPVWAFHGEADDVIPVQRTEEMVAALESMGGHVRMTTFPRLKHSIMNEVYNHPELYHWLLQHKKVQR